MAYVHSSRRLNKEVLTLEVYLVGEWSFDMISDIANIFHVF
jgi:hypothetical protein